MAFPWLAALRAIPWGTLIASAPAMARAAETLAANVRARQAEAPSMTDVRRLADRIAELEERELATTELVRQMSVQLAELTSATTRLAVRLRWMSWIASGATLAAFSALIVAFTR